jgi:hypothetical protein
MSDVHVSYGPAPIETPSQALVKDANRIVTATDARGRKLGIRNMANSLARFRLVRVLGADAYNQEAMAQALLFSSVVSVNDDPVPFPRTELQLEALIDRLGFDGLRTVQKVQTEEFGCGAGGDTVDHAKN